MDATTEFEDNDEDDHESNSDEDERCFLERFLKKHKQHQSRKKQTNALILEAQQLINELQHGVPRKKFLAKKGVSKEVQLVLKIHLGQMTLQRRTKLKTPKERIIESPRFRLCESSWCTNGPTSKSRNVTSKRHDKGSCKT